MIIRILFLGVALALPFALTADREETRPVRIILEARPDAKFYQVEWLEESDVGDDTNATPAKSLREKITKTEIKRNLPLRFKYFRLRSAYRENLFGPWGDVVEIPQHNKQAANQSNDASAGGANNTTAQDSENSAQTDKNNGNNSAGQNSSTSTTQKITSQAKSVSNQDVFVQVIDKNGKQKWVLRGKAVPAERLDQNQPLYYDVECLTDTNAPENTNGHKKYEGPIPFERAGEYRMHLYATDDTAQIQPLQTWVFWVYTDVPRTYVKFYAPFLHGKGGFTVGGKTKIALRPQLSGAAIDKIEYRIYRAGETAGAWAKYDNEIEVNSFAKGQYGDYNIEYQTTNVAGATEPPQVRRMLIDAKGPVVEEIAGGKLICKDENFPIVVRIYQNGKLIQDEYFKQWSARDQITPPTGSYEMHAIDLLGNETVVKK